MKSCPNCRVIHPDDYMGTCHECGAALGNVAANAGASGGDLRFAWASQIQSNVQETSMEPALRRGQYGGLRFDERLMEVARAGAYLLDKAAGRDWEKDA